MKRLGPDLKVPDLKTLKLPAAVGDVYYDLRDRRLLPLVALIVVAIAAVPFLLGGNAEDPETLPPPGVGSTLEDPTGTPGLTVVEATPGLRDYRKRLARRTPTDPFKQRYTSVPEAAQLESSLSNSASSEASSSGETVTVEGDSTTTEIDPGSSGDSGDGSSGGDTTDDPADSGADQDGIRLLEFRFDIQVSRIEPAGTGQGRTTPQMRRQVPSLTQLPSKRSSVATVGGVNINNGAVFFLVSDDVESLDGKFVCKTRTQGGLCELVELGVGVPLELVAGPNDVRYRIKVIGIDTVLAGKPRDRERSLRAAVGGTAAEALPQP